MKPFNLQMKRSKDSGCSLRKKREVREEELKKNEDAILKFVNISSDAMLLTCLSLSVTHKHEL